MIKHKTATTMVMFVVIISIMASLGGWIHGNIVEGYEELRNNDKVDSAIIDKLIEAGEAEVIILLKEGKWSIQSIQEDVIRGIEEENFEIKHRYSQISAISGSLDRDALENLIASEQVEKIYFDESFKINLDESIPLIDGDYLSGVIRNNTYLRGKYQTACVLDTGVDPNHPALSGRVIGGWNYYDNNSNYSDDHGHGTHVAGIIASNDSTYTGVAPEANIIAIKVCDSTGGDCPASYIMAGIDWCVNNASIFNISVISMSLGNDDESNSTNCKTTMDSSINNAFANGLFLVASSGNNGFDNGIAYPACSPNITSVGSSDYLDNIGEETNIGDLLDILAPGENIKSSVLGNSFSSKSGTSLAVPHVTGAALILIQNKKLEGVTLTPDEIRTQLKISDVNISEGGRNYSRLSLKISILSSDLILSYEISPYPKTNANISFFANYTNRTSDSAITSATCEISFVGSLNNPMDWNASQSVYQYIRNFTSAATYDYNITCNHSNYETLIELNNIEVVQGSENCSYPGSNIDWNLTGTDFSRCVGETLLINQSHINIQDNSEFILTDTEIILIDASIDYSINVSANGNLTLDNVTITGYSSSNTMDVEIHGSAQIYNSTFTNSRVMIYGNNQNIIENSTLKDEFYTYDTSITTITDSNFEDTTYFNDNSITNLINSDFASFVYLEEYAQIKLDNTSAQSWIFMTENSSFNATSFTNISNGSFSVEGTPTISGEIDMPTTYNIDSGINATRYFPVYVYYNDGITPYPNKAVSIIDSSGETTWEGTTNSQGYIDVPQTFNESNYASGNFSLSVNPTENLYLTMDTPIIIQTSDDAPDGDDGGSGGGFTTVENCIENWTCDDWMACIEGVQRRVCDDANMCATFLDRPSLIQGCEGNSLDNTLGGGSSIPSGSGTYHIHEDDHPSTDGNDCCLWRMCGSLRGLCWYWWVILTLVIVSAFIILWKLEAERKKKKKRRHRMTKALGIDWLLHHTHLDEKKKKKIRKMERKLKIKRRR